HTIALKNDGTVWAWGWNNYGQLGDGATIDRTTPVQVSGLTNVTAIAGGAEHTIVLKNDGTVWAWGRNIYGQLGDGTTIDRTTPVQVSTLTNVNAIAGGGEHTIVLKNDGTVWAWGWNIYGELGDGTTIQRTTPVQVSGLTNVTAIAGGWLHTIAIKKLILEGNVLRVGVSNTGGLIDDDFTVGIDYDKNGTAAWTAFDFLKPGSPFEFYSIGVDNLYDAAGYDSGDAFGATTTNTSSGSALSALTTGSFNGLDIRQAMTFLKDSGVIEFTITLTNSSGTTMTNLAYARGMDPDQDVYAAGGNDTINDIPRSDLVTATAPVTNWTIGIRDVIGGGVPSVDSGWDSNPYNLFIQHNDGNGDYTINMAWSKATLAPNESWVIRFQYIIDDTKVGVVDPLTITTAGLPSGDVGKPYSTILAATGGMPPYTWSDDNNLPPGLYLNTETGELYGTLPASTNPITFVVTVRDTSGNIASATFEYIDPRSGSGFKAAGGCFIATAAYGSYLHPHVESLREFRDRYLVTNPLGRLFVKAYYTVSPPIADYIRASETRRAVARFALFPVVYGVEHPGTGLAGIGFVLGAALLIGFKRK
ncbi:MAG: putative Ig domain-containing protein, partial [Deltaproteobacteria bacterium]|nr:putative Ig domain-containing protein [Deltaproteobacteria bacterium]